MHPGPKLRTQAFRQLIAGVAYHEKIRRFQWAAIGIEPVGVVVLTVMSGGLMWLFLAALSLSTYNILQRKLTQKYSAMQASTCSIFFGTILLAIFSPAAFRELAAAPAVQYAYLAILGILPSAVAYVSWSVAFSKAARTSQVSNYTVLTLFFTSLLGILIAHETPNAATLCGGSITLLGVLLLTTAHRCFKSAKRPVRINPRAARRALPRPRSGRYRPRPSTASRSAAATMSRAQRSKTS